MIILLLFCILAYSDKLASVFMPCSSVHQLLYDAKLSSELHNYFTVYVEFILSNRKYVFTKQKM